MKRLRKFFAGLLALTTLVSTVPVNAYDADVPSVLNTGNETTEDEVTIVINDVFYLDSDSTNPYISESREVTATKSTNSPVYEVNKEGWKLKEVRYKTVKGSTCIVNTDENGKYINAYFSSGTVYYFIYKQTDFKTITDYYDVFLRDDVEDFTITASYAGTTTNLYDPDEGDTLVGTIPTTEFSGYNFKSTEIYDIDISNVTDEWLTDHKAIYRFYDKLSDMSTTYKVRYIATLSDGTPVEGVKINGVATGEDGFTSYEDTFVLDYLGKCPGYNRTLVSSDSHPYTFSFNYRGVYATDYLEYKDYVDNKKVISLEIEDTNNSNSEKKTNTVTFNLSTGGESLGDGIFVGSYDAFVSPTPYSTPFNWGGYSIDWAIHSHNIEGDYDFYLAPKYRDNIYEYCFQIITDPDPLPMVEVFEVYDYDYDNATSLGVVSIDSTKTITASVSRNNDTLEVTSSQIKIPLNTASYVSYKGYNWSENRGSSTCAKVGKVITADDKLYICYETTPVTINIADCYTTSLDYLSNDVVTRISDSVVGGTTKKYYVLDRAGYEFKEVRKGNELGEIVPILEDENGKYIEVTATDYTNYYFRYLRTANETYKVDYYNVYNWDFDNAEYVETYSKLIAPDGTVSYEGTKLLDDSGNWIDANKEGYIFDGHYSIELETEGEFEKQHTVYYRFFSSDTDKNIDYTIKYQAVWNDGTPAQGVILNEETTGVDGFISTEDNFKVTYEGLRPIYQVQQNNDILECNFNNQFKWTGMTCADFTDSTKTIELVATNPSINETSTRSLVLEKRNTWTGGTKYNISEFNGDNFSSLFFATSNSTENIELEYSDAGVEHTLVVKVNMGVKPTVKKLKVPVEIIYQKDTTVLPDYTGQDYETVTIENTTFPEVEVIVKEHVIGDGYTIISTPTLTFNLEDYDFSAGLQAVANSYGVDISKLSLKEKDCGVGYSAFNTGENDGIYDESEFDNLIKTLVVDDTTKLLDSSVTFSVKEDLAHFGKFTIFLKYTVEPPSVIVHYKDTDGNTLREDNVYIDYTKVYYPVEKIDDYIPTGVVEGSVIYPVVLEQEQQFAEYRGDNTGDKSHTLKLRLGSPMNITSFQDSEITVIYEKEPSYKITVVDEFYNIDGNLVKADERLVEYKKAGENYSYYALDPVPDGYICFSDTSYSGVVTQDTIITFVYKDDYARFVTVKGVVMYKDGTPVANKRIEIHSTPRYTVTDENGYYEVNNVEVGDHKFTIFANDEDDTPLVTCDLSVTKPDEDTVKVTFKSENTDVETDTSVTDILEIDAYLPVYTIKVIDEYYTDGVLDKSEVRCEDSYKAGETYAYSALSPEDYTVSGITEALGVALSNLTITFKYLKTTTKPDEPEPASYRLKVIDNFYNSDYVLQDSSVRVNNEVTEGTPYDYKALDVVDYKVSGTKHYTGVIKEDTTLVFTYIQEVKEPERYTLKVRDIFFDENGIVEKDSVRYEKIVDSGFSYYFKALDTADYKVTSAIEVNGVVTQNTEIIFTYAKKTIPVPEPEAKEYKITVIDKFIIGKDVIEYNPYYFDNLGDEVTVTETEDGYELSIARFVTEDHEVSVQSIVRCIDTYKEGAEYFYSALNLPESWKVISDTHYSGVVTKDETLVFVYALNFEDDDDIPEIPDNPEPTIPFEEPVTGIETGKGLEVVIFFGCLIALLVILKKKEK